MNLHNITCVARYESKILMRSWLFRIFAILAVLLLSSYITFTTSTVFNSATSTWSRTALPSMMPFLAIYYYNIFQAFIICFMSGSFLDKTKKIDTAEVLLVRPLSNSDFIIGKTWGISRIFILLNIFYFIMIFKL